MTHNIRAPSAHPKTKIQGKQVIFQEVLNVRPARKNNHSARPVAANSTASVRPSFQGMMRTRNALFWIYYWATSASFAGSFSAQNTERKRPCFTVPTPGGTQTPESCVFPFTFDNVTFFECTPHLHTRQLRWCSVEVDPATGIHVSGKGRWGHCDPDSGCREIESAGVVTSNVDTCGRICKTVSE